MPLSSCASGKISVGLITALKSVLKSTLDPQPKITKTIGYQFRKPEYLEHITPEVLKILMMEDPMGMFQEEG